jgi:hypothetical protein
MGSPRPPSLVSKATLHDVADDHIMMSWTNFTIAVFRRETTLEGVRKLSSTYESIAAAFPYGVYLVTIVEEGAPMPAPDARQALTKFLMSGAGRTRMSAVIHEGSGFRAAAVRSVVTGLAMAARLPYPHKVFASVAEAGTWFATSPDQAIDSTLLLASVADGRQRAARPATTSGLKPGR